MRQLGQQPVRMDNTGLQATLGHEPPTPLDEATLRVLACLPPARGARDNRANPFAPTAP
ncbi:MAG: hypothetical protein ACK4R2_00700 [Roseateles sp.]